jgi:hypothetical protein
MEFTSSATGNFYGITSQNIWAVGFGLQFYNNVLDYPKPFDTITYTVGIFGDTMDNETTIDRNFTWANNIFMPGASKHVVFSGATVESPTGVHGLRIFSTASNRNIYTRRGNYIGYTGGGGYTFADANAAGKEVDSITADPLLDADYRPQEGSPAIGFGRDVFGRFGPVNGVVDAGCYPTGTEVIGVID